MPAEKRSAETQGDADDTVKRQRLSAFSYCGAPALEEVGKEAGDKATGSGTDHDNPSKNGAREANKSPTLLGVDEASGAISEEWTEKLHWLQSSFGDGYVLLEAAVGATLVYAPLGWLSTSAERFQLSNREERWTARGLAVEQVVISGMIESLFMGDGAVFMKISDGATACDVRHNFQGAVDLTSYKERAITIGTRVLVRGCISSFEGYGSQCCEVVTTMTPRALTEAEVATFSEIAGLNTRTGCARLAVARMNHLDGADGTLRPGNGAGDVETCARVLYTALLQPKGPQRRAVGRQSWDVLADGAWQIGKRFEPAIIGAAIGTLLEANKLAEYSRDGKEFLWRARHL